MAGNNCTCFIVFLLGKLKNISTCAVLRCINNQMKNKDKSFLVCPQHLRLKKAWLNAINRKEGNLPHKVVVFSDHFEEQCFNCSWWLQNELYYSDRPVERKLIKGAIPTILPYQNLKGQQEASLERGQINSRREVSVYILSLVP